MLKKQLSSSSKGKFWRRLLCCSQPKTTTLRILDYSRSGLEEVPPIVFSHERTLEVLLVDSNNITELPRLLFQLEELKVLNLSDNVINTLPGAIGELRHLEKLYLQRNCLVHSSVHYQLKQCNKLTILDMSSNGLDRIPDSLASLINLQELYLNDVGIDFLPATIGRLSHLRILELRDNHLSILPKALHRLELLHRLDVGNNELTEVPDVIGKLINLRELWMDNNNISNISSEVQHLHKIAHFDASCNEIEKLPAEIGSWLRCVEIDVSSNLIDSIPNTIGNLRSLQTLKLHENHIKELPATVGRCLNLEEIAVQYNLLKELPSAIGYLRKLRIIVLAKNRLQSLPPEIGSCVSLAVLNLHSNFLTRLPDEIGHLHRLSCIDLVDNKLEYLPVSLGRIPSLSALWLSSNQSTPLIPLQNDRLPTTGASVLTCYLLPQSEIEPVYSSEDKAEPREQTSRHIMFQEPNKGDRPGRLTRAPTPFPRDFERYQKSLLAKRGVASVSREQIEIKEAKVTTSPRVSEAIQALDLARRPPPYHIAALFSKHAHKFNNAMESPDISIPDSFESEEPPKSFTQELPPRDSFIHAPTPHRPPQGVACHHQQEFQEPRMAPIVVKDTTLSPESSKWLFGPHRSPKVISVHVKPTEDAFPFTFQFDSDGVFVERVMKESNAWGYLQRGDKILEMDGEELAGMAPEQQAQFIIDRAPNCELYLISRTFQY